MGSIGTRHLRLLKKKYDFEIFAYRNKKSAPKPGIINIYDKKRALETHPEIAFITNPTHLHIETAISCLRAGIRNLFIEKPLSHTSEGINYLIKEAKKNNALVYVSNLMRYNPIIKRLKEIVEEKKDQIYYAHTECCSYLPNWRPDRDYRKIYSAMKDQGGGVILDLIHEFDYNEWLFGKIKSIPGRYGKISNLEIDSEDFCDVSLEFNNNIKTTIHLDYFSRYKQRSIKVITQDQEIFADLVNKQITIINNTLNIKKEVFKFERDDYFEQQHKYFLDGVDNQSLEIDNLNEAKELLEKLFSFKDKNKMITK